MCMAVIYLGKIWKAISNTSPFITSSPVPMFLYTPSYTLLISSIVKSYHKICMMNLEYVCKYV